MRVISGIYKRRRFDVPHTFKARPTTDFAKENLFNVLNKYIDFEDGIVALDLFAGTGSISIELVSRGCDRVVSVEKDPQHLSFINKVMKEVKTDKCIPLRADAFKYMERCSEKFDFIFADPPYALEKLSEIPDKIFEYGLLKEDGLFVLEHGKDLSFNNHPHFIEHRYYGSVNFSFFGFRDKDNENETEREELEIEETEKDNNVL
ncbi:MAG: RsmD family RNA methyltransferase [Phocaeicola sp.]|nr:RsmD family RNA methyltransferase [Phocaeicola sp.]